MVPVIVVPFRARSAPLRLLRRGALDVDRPRTLRAVGHLELDSITLAQVGNALTIDSSLVKEIVLARLTLDEPEALVYSQRPNCSRHVCLSDFWCLMFAALLPPSGRYAALAVKGTRLAPCPPAALEQLLTNAAQSDAAIRRRRIPRHARASAALR